MGRVLGDAVFWVWHCYCTYDLTAAVVIWPRPPQDHISQHSDMDGGGAHKAPILAKELPAVDGSWGGGNFLRAVA